jgi:ketopantoate reductase
VKVLVYGAAVLGSLYAGRLKESGHDVTVLARGKRFDETPAHEIVLEHALKGTWILTLLKVTRQMRLDDCYDLVLVVMRRNQIADVLPQLTSNKQSALFVFMVNNPCGYDEWLKAVGRDHLCDRASQVDRTHPPTGWILYGGVPEHGCLAEDARGLGECACERSVPGRWQRGGDGPPP